MRIGYLNIPDLEVQFTRPKLAVTKSWLGQPPWSGVAPQHQANIMMSVDAELIPPNLVIQMLVYSKWLISLKLLLLWACTQGWAS